MKTPSLVALVLAGALSGAALAQDSSSSQQQPQTPPAASSSQSTPAATTPSQPATSAPAATPDQSSQSSSSTPAAQTPDQSSQSSSPAASSSSSSSQSATPSDQTSTSTTAATDNSATQQQADQTAQKAENLKPIEYQKHEGFWGHLNPFARKKYVQRQLQPMQDRLNELDELTGSNAKLIKDVDARATQGIQLASAKANEADRHAVDAGNRAQLANQTATDANTHLQSVQKVVSNIDQYQTASQVEIHFRPGQQVLSKKAKDALDQLATPLKDQKGYIVEVQGFSAGRGISAVQNSQLMADAVTRYLVADSNIPVYRIYRVGMGNTPVTNSEGKAERIRGGKVEISLLKNGVGDLEPAPVAGGGGVNGNLPQSDQSAPAAGNSYSGAKAQPDSTSKPAQPQQQTPQQPQSPQQPQ